MMMMMMTEFNEWIAKSDRIEYGHISKKEIEDWEWKKKLNNLYNYRMIITIDDDEKSVIEQKFF